MTCPGQEEPAVFGGRAILAQRIRVEWMPESLVSWQVAHSERRFCAVFHITVLLLFTSDMRSIFGRDILKRHFR